MFSNFLLSCQRGLFWGGGERASSRRWIEFRTNSTRDFCLALHRSMQVRFTLFLLKELNNFWFHHRWSKQSPVTSINLAIHNSCNLGGQQSHVSKRRGEILGICTEKTKGNLSSAILQVQQKLGYIHHTPQTLIFFAWKLELKREGRCQGAEHTKWPHLLTRAAGKWKAPPLASICTLQAHQEQYFSCLARTWRNAIQNVYASSSATNLRKPMNYQYEGN